MTNSEDTTTGDNLSNLNSSASKVNESYPANSSSSSQAGGNPQKESCSLDISKVNGTGGEVWHGGGSDGEVSRVEDAPCTVSKLGTGTIVCPDGQLHSVEGTLQSSTLPPQLPFRLCCGEKLEFKCDTTEGILALTNYRLFIKGKITNFNIPIGVIEQVENRDIFYIHVSGKDARCIRCTFPNNETATEAMKRIQTAVTSQKTIEETFAYTFFQKSEDETSEDIRAQLGLDLPEFPSPKERFDMEIKRMEFNVQGPWRISDENKDYELCGSYPTHIIVPSNMTKKQLEMVACFRSAKRIPAVVWRHRGNGAVISRCSQPEVGWFGWRSSEDEELVQNIVMACADNSKMTCNGAESTTRQPERIRMESESESDNNSTDTHNGSLLSMELVPEPPNTKKLLILDARSYTTAVANRARGGGCECLEYYPRCEIQFMNLANIHSIRKSFTNVRQLCTMTPDQSNSWYSQLESCKWLQHMSGLMKAAATVVTAIEEEGRPVMVHCSDGWDRTPQIVALAEILLDPYYRSLEGFQVLVEREWLDFGHKFADRCGQALGSEDVNERCPVFLQWLDCLHQLIRQFPTAFEFNLAFLVKLAQHTYSNLFGTFLCNTAKERQICKVDRLTHSVWRFLRAPANASKFRNNLYLNCDKALWPSCEVRDLVLWSQVYLGYENPPSQTTEILNPSQESSPAPSVAADCEMSDRMAACKNLNKSKTRSCEDLHSPYLTSLQRRQSDPNLSDSFHAGESCDDDEDMDLPLRTSTPRRNKPAPTERLEVRSSNDAVCDSGVVGRLLEFDDSENDDTEPNSESKSESTVVSISLLDPKSIESSTDTLIADTNAGGLVDNGVSETGKKNIGDRLIPKTDINGTSEVSKLATEEWKTENSSTPNQALLSDAVCKKKVTALEISKRGGGLSNVNHTPDECNGVRTKLKCVTAENSIITDSTAVEEVLQDLPLSIHCEVCETSRRLLSDPISSCVQGNANHSSNTNMLSSSSTVLMSSNAVVTTGCNDTSKVCSYNTPMHSRTPSTGVPATPDENGATSRSVADRQLLQDVALSASSCSTSLRSAFDVDGLSSLHDEVQNRLNNIVFGYRSQIEILQRELQLTRDALMKQVCHTCTHHVSERPDDVASVGDSLGSGEHQSVGHESQSSEISWEAVDEKDTRPPLWLPDYAVSHCMGCEASFWLGRRKHHCRSCGKIFCADCSDQTITIPSEQFFTPVRVCTACFQRLASHSSENVPGPNGSALLNGNMTNSSSDDHNEVPTVCIPCRVQHSGHSCSSNVPSSFQKDANHSSKISTTAVERNGTHYDRSVGCTDLHSNVLQGCNPTYHSKMTRNHTCKQQSTASSNDLQNHHAAVAKGN